MGSEGFEEDSSNDRGQASSRRRMCRSYSLLFGYHERKEKSEFQYTGEIFGVGIARTGALSATFDHQGCRLQKFRSLHSRWNAHDKFDP